MAMRRAHLLRLTWGPAATTGTVAQPPQRKRHFVMKESRTAPAEELRQRKPPPLHSSTPHRPPPGVARELSQRERYRAFREKEEVEMTSRGVPGEWLSPVPRHYRLFDGVDEHGYDAPRYSKEERRVMMQAALERNAASVVEFTDGGERDIDLGGMPDSEFHGREGWTTIPRESALYNTVIAKGELESRQRHNSWSMARRKQGPSGENNLFSTSSITEMGESVIDDARRRHLQDEGSYSNDFEGSLLEPNEESICQPRSTYGLRKLFVGGLTGYQGMISKAEEAQLCDELLHLLQDPRAAYIAEETRYCVNLYERELGIPGKDTLAFSIDRAPTLQRVLARFFHLGLIPSPPNICQVSEMVGNFSGYPVHKKPATIGPYVGILNLISTTVMHLQHVDCPWFPRLYMNPRSLFVVEHPCLDEYKMGYKQTHQPFHAFEYATRVSKDYRIEVLFATVEAAQMRYLKDAMDMTEYAEKKAELGDPNKDRSLSLLPSSVSSGPSPQDASVSPFSGSTDKWLTRLREQLHAQESTAETESKTLIDGELLREELMASGVVGSRPHSLEKKLPNESDEKTMSPAQRRMSALKARYAFAKRLKEEAGPQVSSGGVRVIPGHSPRRNQRL